MYVVVFMLRDLGDHMAHVSLGAGFVLSFKIICIREPFL